MELEIWGQKCKYEGDHVHHENTGCILGGGEYFVLYYECANWEIKMYFLNFWILNTDILMEGLKALISNASTLQFS